MLEAMASALPIIASRMPAHETVVKDHETGILCTSVDDYAQALSVLEDVTTNRRFGEAARKRVTAEVGTWDDCAMRYRRVYENLLGERSID
jgi:glycosyltransferase involved in cell wall biosynthesis